MPTDLQIIFFHEPDNRFAAFKPVRVMVATLLYKQLERHVACAIFFRDVDSVFVIRNGVVAVAAHQNAWDFVSDKLVKIIERLFSAA